MVIGSLLTLSAPAWRGGPSVVTQAGMGDSDVRLIPTPGVGIEEEDLHQVQAALGGAERLLEAERRRGRRRGQ